MAIRVLLVDDVPDIRLLVRTALRFRSLFVVVGEASTGAEGVALASALRPDVVVLDIGLPDLAGQQVLTQIRDAAPETKVVVFSGTEPADSAGIADRVEGYAMKDGQVDYLIELLEAVGRQHTAQAMAELALSLDSARHGRQLTRSVLLDWGLPELIDDAQLVVSELINNAITHASSGCELRVFLNPVAVRIEVVDNGPGTPDPLPYSQTRTHGRGLHLIDAVTGAWGVEPTPGGGKLVWAEIPRQ